MARKSDEAPLGADSPVIADGQRCGVLAPKLADPPCSARARVQKGHQLSIELGHLLP